MKLIDADKLLKWLQMQAEGNNLSQSYYALKETIKQIESGIFDPKPKDNEYECPNCRSIRTRNDWNEETARRYGEVIVKLGDKDEAEADYICPTCQGRSDFHELEVGSNDN